MSRCWWWQMHRTESFSVDVCLFSFFVCLKMLVQRRRGREMSRIRHISLSLPIRPTCFLVRCLRESERYISIQVRSLTPDDSAATKTKSNRRNERRNRLWLARWRNSSNTYRRTCSVFTTILMIDGQLMRSKEIFDWIIRDDEREKDDAGRSRSRCVSGLFTKACYSSFSRTYRLSAVIIRALLTLLRR